MSNSSTLKVSEQTTLPAGTYIYDSVVIESSGVLTCEGNVSLTTTSFILKDGGQITITDNTTIDATTFTKDVASS